MVNLEARGTGGPSLLFETAGSGAARGEPLRRGGAAPGGKLAPLHRVPAAPQRHEPDRAAPPGRPGREPGLHRRRGPLPHAPRRPGPPRSTLGAAPGGERARAGARARRARRRRERRVGLVRPARSLGGPLPGGVGTCRSRSLALLLARRVGGGRRPARRRPARGGSRSALLRRPPGRRRRRPSSGYGAGRALGLDPIFRPWVATPGPLVASFFLAGRRRRPPAGAPPRGRARADGLRAGHPRRSRRGRGGARRDPARGLVPAPRAVALAGGLAGLPGRRAADAGRTVADLATMLAARARAPPAGVAPLPGARARGRPRGGGHGRARRPAARTARRCGSRPGPAPSRVAVPAALGAAALAVAVAPPGRRRRRARAGRSSTSTRTPDRARPTSSRSSDLGRLPEQVRAAAPFSASARGPASAGERSARPSRLRRPRSRCPGRRSRCSETSREGDAVRWRARLRSPRGAPGAPGGHSTLGQDSLLHASTGIPVPTPCPSWPAGTAAGGSTGSPAGPEGRRGGAHARPRPGRSRSWSRTSRRACRRPRAAVAAARPPWAVTQQEGDVTLFTRRVRSGRTPRPVIHAAPRARLVGLGAARLRRAARR